MILHAWTGTDVYARRGERTATPGSHGQPGAAVPT
jgi:hypothetical protein